MRTQPKIPLQKWAARKWDPPPCRKTLYNWVRNASIEPPPEKVGKTYYVAHDAQYIDKDGNVTS